MKHYKLLLIFILLAPQLNFAQRFFDNSDQYLTHTEERTGFKRSKIIIENFISNQEFVDNLTSNELFTFYGIAYKGNMYSASQLQNKSCWGQFLALCKGIDMEEPDYISEKIIDITYLNNLNFDEEKKTVIFIYSSELRKGQIKTFIEKIKKEIEKDDMFDYFVLSLDYPKIVKH